MTRSDKAAAADPSGGQTNEEPELSSEESVPLDGKDPIGEKMMEELGRDKKAREDRSAPRR
jgi:hypothetical protein